MVAKHGRQFLVLVSVYPYTRERLASFVPALKTILEQISSEPLEQLFRSPNGDYFGYLVRTTMAAQQIIAILESPQKNIWQEGFREIEPLLTSADHLFVIELGTDAAGASTFSRALTWLQRH